MPWSLNFNNVPSSPHPPKVDKNGNFVDESFEGVDGYPYTEGADGFLNWILGDRGANRANAFTAASQEDAQAHEFEMAQYNYQQQQALHEFNLVNDPILMAQGLKGAGLSSAAVAQALTGNTPNGYSPTVNPSGSPHGTGAQPHTPAAAQALMELPLQFAQAKLANAQADFTQTQNDWYPRLTQQQIDESNAKIRQEDEKIGISKAETDSKIALNNALVGKTEVECEEIRKNMLMMDAQAARWAHQNDLDDAKAFEAFNNAVLAQKKGRVADAEVGKVIAETEKAYSESYAAQSEGALNYQNAAFQWEATDLKRMEAEMFDMKLQIAQQVGMPIESDEVGNIFMSMCTGNFAGYSKAIFTDKAFLNNMTFGSTYNENKHQTPVSKRERRNPWTNVNN